MRRFAVNIIIFQLFLPGTQMFGWGYEVHRRITKAAVQAIHLEISVEQAKELLEKEYQTIKSAKKKSE